MVQVRHPTQQQPRFGIAPHGLGRIRLWAPVAVGIGEVLRCRSALQVLGKLGNGSRDQWNNAKRTWSLVSQTYGDSDCIAVDIGVGATTALSVACSPAEGDRKSTRLNSSHLVISYA